MQVAIVGDGPAAEAVTAALGDASATVVDGDLSTAVSAGFAVVVDSVGGGVFERATDRMGEANRPWIAVELGGIGGYPVVEASVTGFAPGTACFRCLSRRVASTVDPEAEATPAPPAHTARFAGAVAGRAAARFAAEGADDVFGRVRELPYARRRLLPLPSCECHDGAVDRSLELTSEERSLEESLALAEAGLDERVGLVREVGEVESYPVPYYLARVAETSGFSDASAASEAAGVAAGWDEAFMKALGEAYERYCAGVYRTDDLEAAPPSTVENAVRPGAFVCRDEPDPESPIAWVQGENLSTGGSVSLPAGFVHYPPDAEVGRPAITTGLGLGNSTVEALCSGLYETVERDATMLSWYSTFEPLGLTVEDDDFETLVARAGAESLSVTTLLVTQDVDVPVVVVGVRRDRWPKLAVGSAANLDPVRAATSALTEALQNWMELRSLGPEDAADAGGRIGHYADEPGAAADYLDPDTTVSAASVGPDDPPTGRAAFDGLLDRLKAADCSAYGVRLTTRDVEALGFEAVRTLVPSAQPLFFGDSYFGDRARSVPADLGYEPALDRDHHPFP